MLSYLIAFSILAVSISLPGTADAATAAPRVVSISHSQFNIDGKQVQIISGDLHYARVPRAYWHDRLAKAKSMGLNAITTYVFWNLHEATPGHYDFTGEKDIRAFIREAQSLGLYVILRPGPYICAEWEMGGFPSWLLKDHHTLVRTSDPGFIAPATAWMNRLGREISDLEYGKGGPIIAVQIENEYGSFGSDKAYLEQIHQLVVKSGFNSSVLFTSNGIGDIKNGSLPGVPTVVNFGPGKAKEAFDKLYRFQSGLLMMSGEYWAGWFDAWGGHHHSGNISQEATELEWMLRHKYSVNIYMFHGGSNFGWMNGADSTFFKPYAPGVTSYDYDAALDESGVATPKYYAFKNAIESVTGRHAASPVATPPVAAVNAFALNQSVSLWESLPEPVASRTLLTMEDVDQSYGYILYRTTLRGPIQSELEILGLHDYAEVFLDKKLVGTMDRRLGESRLWLDVGHSKVQLDILIENTGRIGHSHEMQKERKGITKQVSFDSTPINNWLIYSLSMTQPSSLRFRTETCSGPCFYRSKFSANSSADTFLDTTDLGKGMVWINGRPLGRFWEIGPQHTLYLPAPWLRATENTVEVFDLHGDGRIKTLRGIEHPLLGRQPAHSHL